MGRGVSCGGGQSSLGYLFGDSESGGNAPPPTEKPNNDATTEPSKTETSDNNNDNNNNNNNSTETETETEKPPSEAVDKNNQNADDNNGHDSTTNNYFRADGQNCGNFITNRPSTKVHAAPGGSSSLGYLFSDDKK